MIPENIIRMAQEGGWEHESNKKNSLKKVEDFWIGHTFVKIESQIICDPLFWKALGKSAQWDEWTFGPHKGEPHIVGAKRFFDLLLSGGDTSSFWKSISDKK